MNFNDLVNRSQIVSEGKVSPYGVKNPVFKDITTRLKTAGASSPPYDTMQVIINVLKRLNIISQEEETNWLSRQGFSLKKNALLGFIDLYKEDIIRRAEEVKETIEDELPKFFKRAGTNRGAAKGPSRGETKYAANAANEEMKAQARKQKNEAKKLAKELRQQAKGKGKGPRAAAAVEVIATGLDEVDMDAFKAFVDVRQEALIARDIEKELREVIRLLRKEENEGQVDIKILNSAEEDVDGNRILSLKTLKKFIEDSAGSSNKSRVRLANYFRNVYDNIYDYYVAGKSEDEEVKRVYDKEKADLNDDGITTPGEEGLAHARGFRKKGFTESTTAEYLTEQVKRDKYKKASTEASLTFTEKFKPKTSWQLQELRNYGL